MKVTESVRISWRNIRGHKLRSTLTTLGVIIGIAAVVAFLTYGASVEADIVGDVEEENEPVLRVYTQVETQGGFGPGDYPVFTERDIQEIESIDGVVWAVPNNQIPATEATTNGETVRQFSVSATQPELFQEGKGSNFTAGGPFTMGEHEAVINQEFQDATDEDIEPGDELTIRRQGSTINVTVTGVIGENPGPDIGGTPPTIYIPTDPFYGVEVTTEDGESQRAYPSMTVRTENVENIDAVKSDIETYLAEDSDAREVKPDEHELTVQTDQELLGQIQEVISQITTLITGFGAIALVVGMIGIANIMLVSVTERTREIGIMKAIGARQRDIVQLFIVESMIIGLIGSILGVLLGLGGAHLVAMGFGEVPIIYPAGPIAIGIGVGVLTGVVAGLYPAWRAARVDPIEALRYE